MLGIDHTPGHRGSTRAVVIHKAHCMAAWFGVDDVVDVTLAPDGDILALVVCDGPIPHAGEQLRQLLRFGMRKLNELKPICACGIISGDLRRRCVVWIWAHLLLLRLC